MVQYHENIHKLTMIFGGELAFGCAASSACVNKVMEPLAYANELPKLDAKIKQLESKAKAGSATEEDRVSLKVLTTMRDEAMGALQNYQPK